jgi:hypothetical protein
MSEIKELVDELSDRLKRHEEDIASWVDKNPKLAKSEERYAKKHDEEPWFIDPVITVRHSELRTLLERMSSLYE